MNIKPQKGKELIVEWHSNAHVFDGYLYVINREQYADGTFGRARLIFPTLLTYNGNNRVKPGQPIRCCCEALPVKAHSQFSKDAREGRLSFVLGGARPPGGGVP